MPSQRGAAPSQGSTPHRTGAPLPPVRFREIAWRLPDATFALFADDPGALLLESVAAADAQSLPASDRGGRSKTAPLSIGAGLVPAGDSRTIGPAAPRVPDARYSYIALDPLRRLSSNGLRVQLDGHPIPESDPFEALSALLGQRPRPAQSGLPPFQGGVAGFLGYDLLHHLEGVPAPADPRRRAPDMAVGLYDLIIAFDMEDRRCWLLSGGLPETDSEVAALRAEARIDALQARLEEGDRFAARAGSEAARPSTVASVDAKPPRLRSDFSRSGYESAVARVVEHIFAGDIFQANLAQRFRVERPEEDDDFALYRRLRAASPAPFAAFLRTVDGGAIASASPERFLALRGEHVEARPIKGTRPRGADPSSDRAMAEALLASTKDQAENVMIVDLLRNDLARVCRDASVSATQLCRLESFAGVHHLVSTVVGRLAPDAGPVDLLRAAFPCGSITGAPRVRAMEIIHQLEPVRRGPYCGSIGWLGLDGDMDLSVAIRTVVLAGGTASIHAGGGIVADSSPAAEYDETLVKAAGLVAAARGLPAPGGGEAVSAMSEWLREGRMSRTVRKAMGAAVEVGDADGATEATRAESKADDPKGADEAPPAPSALRWARGIVRPPLRLVGDRPRATGLVLLIDNYDSFVDSLARYVGELGWSREVIRNDAITVDQVRELAPDRILLSPGPDGPEQAGICIELVRELGATVPILGICLGHQAIAAALGGAVIRARRPVHGRTSRIQHDGQGAFSGLPDPLTVARYHSLVVDSDRLPPDLEVSARTEFGTIMAMRHRRWPVVGLQFHPEAVQTEHGHRLLANVLGEPRSSAADRAMSRQGRGA